MANYPTAGDEVGGMTPVTLPDGRTVNLPTPIAQKAYPSLFAEPFVPVPVAPIPPAPASYPAPTPEQEAESARYAEVAARKRSDVDPEAAAQTDATLAAYGITSPRSPSSTPDEPVTIDSPAPRSGIFGRIQGAVDDGVGALKGALGGQQAPASSFGGGESYSVSGPVRIDVPEFDGVLEDQERAADLVEKGVQGQTDALELEKRIAEGWTDPDGTVFEGTNAVQARIAAEQVALDEQRAEREIAAREAAEAEIAADYERVQNRLTEVGQVNPNRVFHDNSNFDNAMGFLSVALGAMAGVRDGSGKNQGLEQVNKVLERDIRAQEANIAVAQFKVGEARKDQELHDRYRADAKAWRLEEFGMRKIALANKLQADMMKYKNPLKQAEMMAQVGKLQADGGKDIMAARASVANTINAKASLSIQRASQAETARHNAAMEGGKIAPPLLMAHPTKAGVRIAVDPRMQAQFNESQQGEWKKETAFRFDMQRRINKIRALAKEQGATFGPGSNWAALSGPKKALLDAEFTKLQEALLRAATGAAAPEAEVERYQGMLGKRETWLTVDPDLKLQSLSKDLAFQQAARSRVQGLAEYDWNSDFKLDEFKPTKAPTAEGYADKFFGVRKGVEAGVAGDATWRELDVDVPKALDLTLKSDNWNPVEIENQATQLVVLAEQAKAAGEKKTSLMLLRAATKLKNEIRLRAKARADAEAAGEASGYEGFVP